MASERRLIDANALLEKFQFRLSTDSLASHSEYLRTISHCVQIARKLISEASTVDAVEVVRCKDCIHRHYVDMGDEIGAIGGCGLFGTPMMTCNDFCSYGERKDNERKTD